MILSGENFQPSISIEELRERHDASQQQADAEKEKSASGDQKD